jgi:hypothetical protein
MCIPRQASNQASLAPLQSWFRPLAQGPWLVLLKAFGESDLTPFPELPEGQGEGLRAMMRGRK